MPKPVSEVPNPWKPYMDGQIWEFTDAELSGMPYFQPMTNRDHEIIGMRMTQWCIRHDRNPAGEYISTHMYYIRFTNDRAASPEELAGWVRE